MIQWRCQWSAFRGWPTHSTCSRPHLTGKPDWPRADFAKNCLVRAWSKVTAVSRFHEQGPRNYCNLAKNFALVRYVREISEMGGQKMGSNMRPWYIWLCNMYTRPQYIGSTLYWPVHIGSQVKTRQSQSYKIKEFTKTSNFWILKQTLHTTYDTPP